MRLHIEAPPDPPAVEKLPIAWEYDTASTFVLVVREGGVVRCVVTERDYRPVFRPTRGRVVRHFGR